MASVEKILINYLADVPYVTEKVNFGWILSADGENITQEKYRLRITDATDKENCVYDSGKIQSDESAHVTADFEKLPLHRYTAKVEATLSDGETAAAETGFLTGLDDPAELKKHFISPDTEKDSGLSDTALLRKEFTVSSPVKSAVLAATAHGLYSACLNGQKIGEDYFTPGWTSYNKRLQYQVYDVTALLNAGGTNVLGAVLGAGWYKGKMSYNLNRNHYGKCMAFTCILQIEYENGSVQMVVTDPTWKWTKGPVVFSEIYDGETYDSRLEQPGWTLPDFDDSGWMSPYIPEAAAETITAQDGHSVKIMETISPAAILKTPKGETVIDFGQNLTGWCRLQLPETEKSEELEIRYFETLDAAGNVYTDNLRTAKQTIRILCSGGAMDYQPSFTFQGFRYAWVVKWHGEPKADQFTACVLHTAMPRTGSFRCSNELVNQLQHNILWSMKGNSLDVPTDCPQRDERLGWTGDAQIFNSTAMFLMNACGFYSKWLKDIEADQYEDGAVPHIVPDIVSGKSAEDWLTGQGCAGASAWADVAVVLPWNLYRSYGDTAVIERQYDSMKKWIDFMTAHSERGCLFRYKLQFGDWVALDAEEGSYFGATPTVFTSAAYYCYVTKLFAEMAAVVGRTEDADHYAALAESLRKSFADEFMADGHLTVQTQTAQIVALTFNLIPETCISNVAADLKKLLDEHNGHLVTGFLGTPYFCSALSANGYTEDAYDLLLKDDFPSWLYQVKKGATTVWEHWDGLKPDGTMWSADMNSFNHYAYGAVGDWLYKGVCGLNMALPGYKKIRIRPQISEKLTFAEVKYDSLYGPIVSGWKLEDGIVQMTVTVPVNTRAEIVLDHVGSLTDSGKLSFTADGSTYSAETGSGTCHISFTLK